MDCQRTLVMESGFLFWSLPWRWSCTWTSCSMLDRQPNCVQRIWPKL